MRNFKILIGFKWEKTEAGIFKDLKSRDYRVESALRFNKTSIKEYLEKNKDVDACVLKEFLDGGGRWSAKELAELADETDTNIVVVISRAHKGREFVKELYAAGITSAVFSDGKFGVKPTILTDLAIHRRSKPEAREYYGIRDTVINHGVLCYEDYMDHLRYLTDRTTGLNIVDRFVTLAGWLYPAQMGAFIDGMPDEMLQILTQYKEFFRIYNKLSRMGYVSLKIKAPRNLKTGIPKDKLKEKYGEDNTEKKEENEIEIVPVDIFKDAAIEKLEDDASYEEEYEDDEDIQIDEDDDDIYAEARREREKRKRKALSKEKRLREKEERKLKKLNKKGKVVELIEEEQQLPEDYEEDIADAGGYIEEKAVGMDESLDDEIARWL